MKILLQLPWPIHNETSGIGKGWMKEAKRKGRHSGYDRNPVTKNKLAKVVEKSTKVKLKNLTFNEENKFSLD